jgi:hypothetical protein
MTIQALCSAIRSQLYFSQISSWIELLKKAFIDGDLSVKEKIPSHFCHEIMQNPRLKKNLQTMQVDLDILFRIKAYDGTSCFLEKPNVHKFPDTIVSDGMAICVCLKSLPRLDKIPTLNTEKAHLNGFSCDNRIKSSSPVAGTSRHLLNDRMTFSPCHEKGKHVCCKDEEEEEESNLIIASHEKTPAAAAANPTINNADLSTSSSSSSSISALTHRERQLLKYKKRLMKRDKQKKKQQDSSTDHTAEKKEDGNFSNAVAADINMSLIPLYNANAASDGKKSNDGADKATAINNTTNISKHALTTTTTTQLSIATQTEFNDTLMSSSSSPLINAMMLRQCDSCGNQLQCLNCDKVKLTTINDNASKYNEYNQMLSSPLAIIGAATGTMIGKKSDLLLQAIQRTAIAHQKDNEGDESEQEEEQKRGSSDNFNDNIFSSAKLHNKRDSLLSKAVAATALSCDVNTMSDNCDNQASSSSSHLTSSNNNNNNNNVENASSSSYESADCRLCKKQKTKHTPSMNIGSSGSGSANTYRRTMSECTVGMSPDDDETIYKSDEGMYLSPLTMHNCDDSQILNHTSSSMVSEDEYNKILSYGELKSYRRAFSEDVINQLPNESSYFEKCTANDDDECISIKCRHTTKSPIHKLTPNVTLQQQFHLRDASSTLQSKNLNQRIPKINLSHIFNTIQHQTPPQNDSGIGIGSDTIDFSPSNDDSVFFTTARSPVKSYPPTMMQLSPRPSSTVSKRRSRHISDRSSISISELGSDDDDDTTAKCISDKVPSSKISSLYKKFVSKTQTTFNKFSKLPMLATIEENLLHNRFQPKATVEGFKLLLGASGSFCPTQLTIPAQTYFYEFQGTRHLSTPYVVSVLNDNR